ncbi:MAG: HD domain-containing protein [Patescibacteria group bacterium]
MGKLFDDYEWYIDRLNLLCLTAEGKDLAFGAMMKSGLLGDPDWNNVPRHCVRVAEVAEALAMEAQIDSSNIVLAAILHDAKKKVERARAEELIASGMEKCAAFTQAAEEQTAWLHEIGINPKITRMSALSGHASLNYFNQCGATIEEKIFHVADDLCGGNDGTEVVMLRDRIEGLRERYPWLLTEGQDLLGETYIKAQERIASEILDELAKMAGFETGEMLNRHLVKKFAVTE